MSDRVTFEIKGTGTLVTRSVRSHSGWRSVRYNSRRYQLFGGIRTPYWINPDRPLGSDK